MMQRSRQIRRQQTWAAWLSIKACLDKICEPDADFAMMPLDMIEKVVLDLDYSPLTEQESNKVCAFLNLIFKKSDDKAGLRLGVAHEMLTFDQKTNIDAKDAEISAYLNQIIPIFWQRNCLFSFYFYGYFQTVILKSSSQVV